MTRAVSFIETSGVTLQDRARVERGGATGTGAILACGHARSRALQRAQGDPVLRVV
jgi:hypothetical protein